MIKRFSQWFLFLAAIVVLVAVVLFVHQKMLAVANRPAPVKATAEEHPDVSVVLARVKKHEAVVSGYGAASPHYSLTLTSQVSGQVETLAPNFESGKRLKKGDVLASLENSAYKAEVATAQKNLHDAQVALLEEQRAGKQAKLEWKASGMKGKPESALVLRNPQLTAAIAAVTDAKAALEAAQKNFSRTEIKAPFDALVVERSIAPGSFLQAGTEIALLYSTDRVEIQVSLSADEWDLLSENIDLSDNSHPVELSDVQNGHFWTGRLLRIDRHLDETSRLRALVLSVENPLDLTPQFLPGTFVKAQIKGRAIDNLWDLPSSALNQRGEIWFVTVENTLDYFTTEPLFTKADRIYISPPETLAGEEQRVLVHPLNSYTKGMMVNPVKESDNE